jgi:hypothetical protein
MTSKEAKGNLMYALKWNDMPEKEALKTVIKALDNEGVLDEIRTEITEEIEAFRMSDYEANDLLADGLQMALNIIDGAIEEGDES